MKTKTTEKRRGYWTQLALKKKQQDEEKSNNKQQEFNTEIQHEDKTDNKVNPKNSPQASEMKVSNPEAFPNHSKSADDVMGDVINLESSNHNLACKPERIKK